MRFARKASILIGMCTVSQICLTGTAEAATPSFLALTVDSFSQSVGLLPLKPGQSGIGNVLVVTGETSGNSQTPTTTASDTGTSSGTVTGFNANTGVLTGVNGNIAITNPVSTFLAASTGQVQIQGSVTTTWRVAGLTSSPTTLNTVSILKNDPQYSFSTTPWQSININSNGNPAALNGFVTPGSLDSQITTVGNIAGTQQGGGNPVPFNLYLSNNTNNGALPIDAQMTGSLTYSYLNHAQASFSSPDIYLNETNGALNPIGLKIDALGTPANTTGLQFKGGVTCTGTCDGFDLTLTSFADVAAGTTGYRFGTVALRGAPGNFSAVYAFEFWDTAGTGATATQKSHIATLTIESGIPAVPEPHNAAMFLAGLGAIGWMSRRRRSAKDQVAKL